MVDRQQLTADVVQQVQDEVDDTLLQHAPDGWKNEELDAIEQAVLDHTRFVLESLTTAELQSPYALDRHIEQAVAETKRLIHERGNRRP